LEREYIEDESFVVRRPSQTTSEVYVPDQDQDDGNNSKKMSNVSEGNSRYT